MEIEIYYEHYTDSDDHWVCRYGEKEEDFVLDETPLKAFDKAIEHIKEKIRLKKWK